MQVNENNDETDSETDENNGENADELEMDETIPTKVTTVLMSYP